MKLKEFLETLDEKITIDIVDPYDRLIYIGRVVDLDPEDYPKTCDSSLIKVLEVKNNELKILCDYLIW